MMDHKFRQNLLLIAFGVCLFAALFNLTAVLGFLRGIFRVLLPVIAGAILALFLNVPVTGIAKRLERLFSRRKKAPSGKLIQVLSFIMAMTAVLLVLSLVVILLVPQLVRSVQSIYEQLKIKIPEWIEFLDNPDLEEAWLNKLISNINLDKVMASVSSSIEKLLSQTVGILSVTANFLVTAFFAIIFCVYMTFEKERLTSQTKALVRAYLKPSWSDSILRFSNMFSKTFASFLTGQCVEAVILGVLMFLAFTLFKLPYGSLVGVLTAVLAIIPFIGSYISGAASLLLTFLFDPSAVLRCLLVYASVQFVENQFIYPRVVGSSVGLSPLYTLMAALIGGKLFGIPGILFFIPLTAVAVELIKEDAARRVEKRKAAA